MIEPRYTELLNLVNEEILQLQEQLRQQGVKHHLAAGIVLTGGAAQIEGGGLCPACVSYSGAYWRTAEYHRVNRLCSGAVLLDGGWVASLRKRDSS